LEGWKAQKKTMTQQEFLNWLNGVLGDTPLEELVSDELMEHINRIHLEGEHRAWNHAKADEHEYFEMAVRALSKTLFIIGYDAGREQARIDSLFGDGSGLSEDDFGDEPRPPKGLLPS
jgi:hypothetical protein